MAVTMLPVSAASFSDVENDPTVAWAKPYITEMSEKGYIKGYEDGTFKPNNTISKTEALILLSRMIGVDSASYADSVELALEEYSSAISKYSTNYEKEVCFLLYTGVLKTSDLDGYLSTANKNTALKRYEAAVLLTKLLGAEAEVEGNAFVSSSYADTVDIPDSARAYVEYVKEAGIMQGMGNNEQGKPLFSPNTSVTRSQMAKMLCSLIDVLDISVQTGVIVSTDSFNETVTAEIDGMSIINNVSAATKYKIDGKDSTIAGLKKGMNVKITHLAGKVSLIENFTVIEDSEIYGLVSKTTESGNDRTVVIADANNTKKTQTYKLAEDAKVRVNGAIDTFSKIKANNYVKLTISDGLVAEIEVVSKNTSASGTLVKLDATGEFTVLTLKDSKGAEVDYEVSADGVQVSRNNLDSTLGALMEGDSLSLRMVYGKVTKITATSVNQTNSGAISFITFSTSGTTIGIETGGEVTEYKVNKSAEVIIDSADGSVYDLRPGTDIKIKLQSSEIIRIEAAGTISKSQLSGTVKSTNATYGLMVVEENGVEYSVFVNSGTKIIDSVTGNTMTLKSIEKGRKASVTGSNSSGVLEATVIVIQ